MVEGDTAGGCRAAASHVGNHLDAQGRAPSSRRSVSEFAAAGRDSRLDFRRHMFERNAAVSHRRAGRQHHWNDGGGRTGDLYVGFRPCPLLLCSFWPSVWRRSQRASRASTHVVFGRADNPCGSCKQLANLFDCGDTSVTEIKQADCGGHPQHARAGVRSAANAVSF